MKNRQRQKDILFSILIFGSAFAVNLLIQKLFTTQTLVPMIFVFGVFLISLKTHGYCYGITSAIVSVFAVNFAFTYPYYAFDFFVEESILSAVIMLVVAVSTSMGGNRYVILLCVNILLILFGMFLDDSSAMYICAPILTPVLANFGIDPVHFAAIMIVNLGLGCITPPCASVLFMGARVGKSSLTKMLPSTYSLILFVWLPMLAILTLFPDVALWLPRVMLGYGA